MHQVFQGLSLWRYISVNADDTPPQLRKFNARHIPLTLKNLFFKSERRLFHFNTFALNTYR